MKLKGKAIFELTNVETGEKKVVKEENMVTNAFKYLVQSEGISHRGPYYLTRTDNGSSSYFRNMYGNGSYYSDMLKRYTWGLALFEGPLEENKDHIYVTADDPELVGAGSVVAYIGSNTCGGSYNKTESGEIENGYKYVWDFTTSQANGDIGCACLTTLMGGGLGAGSGFPCSLATSNWFGTLISEYNLYSHTDIYTPPTLDYFEHAYYTGRCCYIDLGRDLLIKPINYYSLPYYNGSYTSAYVQNETDINGKVVQKKVFNRSFIYTKSIDLGVYRFPEHSLSLFDPSSVRAKSRKYKDTSTATVYDGQCKHIETVTVNMPQGLIDLIPDDKVQESLTKTYYWPTDINYDEGFMYISFIIPTTSGTGGTVLASGGKIYVWKINMNTFESSYFTITNTTGQSLTFDYDINSFCSTYRQVIVCNDYTILFSNPATMSGNVWIIDNATGSTITQAVNSTNDSPWTSGIYQRFLVRNNMLYWYGYTSNNTSSYYVLNLKTGRVRKGVSYTWNDMPSYICGRTYGTKLPLIITNYGQGGNSTTTYNLVNLHVDPQLLMTINNLEDVVTKTSAETMKVTYIITEEEEV